MVPHLLGANCSNEELYPKIGYDWQPWLRLIEARQSTHFNG